MKNILFILLFLPITSLAQSETQNYIRTLTYKEGINISDPSRANSSVVYYDGVGRPVQQIDGKSSPLGKDIITHIEYDGLGREALKFLSFEASDSNQLFDIDARAHTEQLYVTDKYENTSNPYTQQFFEESPLNRPRKEAAPGVLWKGSADDNDHTIKYNYQFNNLNEVRRFEVIFPDGNTESPELSAQGYYGRNQLYKTIVMDENWKVEDGKSKTTEQFKDKEGRLILLRSYNKMPSDQDPTVFIDVPHDTYHVYDKFSNLTYIIPPLASDKIVNENRVNLFGTINYPFTRLLNVGGTAEADFHDRTVSVANSDLLNVDFYDLFGAKGGFTVETDEDGKVIVNINVTNAVPTAYKTGIIADLSELGNFQDKALGRIDGDGYSYLFLLQNNAIEVQGYGNVPSKIVSFSNQRANLQYLKNYPWTDICVADLNIATKYNRDISLLPNIQILTTYTPNSYVAMGGVSVTVEPDDTVTVSLNVSSDTSMELKSGSAFTILTDRSLENMDLGTISGANYSYSFSVINNQLVISGAGAFKQLNFFSSVRPSVKYYINPDVQRLCYIYRYDKRNRVVEKHVPDNGWTYTVYDKMDRPTMTQDQNLRAESKDQNWLFTKYDALNRIILTGMSRNDGTRQQIQKYFDEVPTKNNEVRNTTGFVQSGQTIHYTQNIDVGSQIQVLSVSYFDDYNFEIPYTAITEQPMPTSGIYTSYTNEVKGLATGSLVLVLDDDSDPANNVWITNFSKYDSKSRPVWNWSYNQYLNAWQGIEYKLDFTDNVLESKTQHNNAGLTVTIYDYFTYDNALRQLRHSQKIGENGSLYLINWNKYDEIGNLSEKMVGGKLQSTLIPYDEYTDAWQTVNYEKNIRGWMKGINTNSNDPSSVSDLFTFWIEYSGQYNGNISATEWKLNTEIIRKKYSYFYDSLNRLTNAIYKDNSHYNYNYNEGPISYDKNGNIKSLERWGYVEPTVYNKIDDLKYEYKNLSNQLLSVTDYGNGAGFEDGHTDDYDYDYDDNGNIKYDLNKGFGSTATEDWFHYNYLNQPTRLNKDSGQYIQYTYDAMGSKIQKKVFNGNTTDITDYVFGFVYLNGELQYFPHSEGYVEVSDNQKFTYFYQYKDHLGNVRVTYTKNSTGLQIQDTNEYYPFGMLQQGNNTVLPSSIANKNKFSGKELQDELSLNVYDFGARNYDPAIGRWFNVDPKADSYCPVSPYNYTLNNPMFFNDPNGEEIWIYWGQDNINKAKYTYVENRDYSKMDAFQADAYRALDALYVASNIQIDGQQVNLLDEVMMDSRELSVVYGGEVTGSHFAYGKSIKNRADSKKAGTDIGTLFFNNKEGVIFDDVVNPKYSNYFTDQMKSGKFNKTTQINSPTSMLGHEIAHAFNFVCEKNAFFERKDSEPVYKGTVRFPNKEEARATTLSTLININLGEHPRYNYAGPGVQTKGVLSNKIKK